MHQPTADKTSHHALTENSVPLFWPFTAAATLAEQEWRLFNDNLKFLAETAVIDHGPPPEFVTPHRERLVLHTLTLRDFSPDDADADETPTLVIAPYAGHHATIADYHPGQSLVETLLANGLSRVLVTDWHSATPAMKDYDIDNYLAELNVCIDDLGGRINLVGLCQGGWMAAMYAARYPARVTTLVLAGSPIDTAAGDGPIKRMVEQLPIAFYEHLVALGDGLMRGDFMLQGWKNMHPDKQYVDKYLELYEHIEDPAYLAKQETFSRWYENPLDLPGRWYLQAIGELFKENRLARGRFVGLGRRLALGDVTCPAYLLAGENDDITTREQVFAAATLLGSPADRVISTLAPGGHIGLFMGRHTLAEYWPSIARWIAAGGAA
ncbi:alpha/beta fold hydrolase [Modicisalibacter coralii]|uniref:alpha/beta fold hydrolase n=1 Tax=Modicisalibacter coralii TaxID=2304602 RepID=UPI00100C11E9|nr:alpha/beta fold hydrolase [Halomonas coralii]